RIGHEEELVLHCARGFDRHARVLLGGPHARSDHAIARERGGGERDECGEEQQLHERGSAKARSGDRRASTRAPRSERARKLALRPSPLDARTISTSGGGSRSPAFSGHSIRLTFRPLKLSRNPASLHSLGSWNL